MKTISRDEARELINNEPNVAVIEVLGPDQFADFHLPRAENVPLGNQFEEKMQQAVADKSQPVLVYCKDTECPASEKAATRLEELGYETVYDYEAGKVDWKEAGLPTE